MSISLKHGQVALQLVINYGKLFREVLFLSQTLLGESNLIAEFVQLMRVLLSLAAALVLITLFQLFKLSLLLISQLCQTFSRLIQLMAKVFN